MPELPEVETLRLQLSRLLPDLIIKDIKILNPKSFIGEKKLVVGKKIVGIRRFAKMLVVDLSDNFSIAIHLKMSGQLIFSNNRQPTFAYASAGRQITENKHTRVILTLNFGNKLLFNDMRKFGWMRIIAINRQPTFAYASAGKQITNNKIETLESLIKHLGPEPLRDLTLKKFVDILKSSRRPIKLVLMDQEKIAGVGNIYANDALFMAKINPKTPAAEIKTQKAAVLFGNLLRVLKNGIKWKGASKTNFVDIYGRKGKVQEHFYVYDREGEECLNKCGANIQKIRQGGRGTFFCPQCQSLERHRRSFLL